MCLPRLFAFSLVYGLTEIVRAPRMVAGVRYMTYEHQPVPSDIYAEVLAFMAGRIERPEWKGYREPYFTDHIRNNSSSPVSMSINVTTPVSIKTWGGHDDIGISFSKKSNDPLSYDLDRFINNGIGVQA